MSIGIWERYLNVAFFLDGKMHFPELGYKVIHFNESCLSVSLAFLNRNKLGKMWIRKLEVHITKVLGLVPR